MALGIFVSNSLFAAANIVSVGGKTYQIQFNEPKVKGCPLDSPMYSAFVFQFTAAYEAGYNINLAACVANCTQGGSAENCEYFCKTSDQIANHKRAGTVQALGVMRDYPPSYRHESCQRAREYCAKKCIEAGVMEESQCRVDCEQYETYNKN